MKKLRVSRFYMVLLSMVCAFAGCDPGNAQEMPNIIFILTDDQRWDALGYAGNEQIHTPEMDALAAEGCYFSKAMVTTPICAGSRASIFTGLYERTHRYTFSNAEIRPEFMQESYPALLREAGYYSGFFGKFGVKHPGAEQLFDVFEDYDRNYRHADHRGYFYKTLDQDTVHLTRYTGQKALDFLEDAPSGRPFCLSLSFSAPHAHDKAPGQYFWQEAFDPLFRDADMPDPLLAGDEYFNPLPPAVRDGYNRLRWTWRFDTPEKYQHSVKGYYRMIAGIDREIAAIREKLKELGMDRNTVIILMGDNGYFLGERQLAGKWLMYDNSLRVPLIIYDPRMELEADNGHMALNIDVPATILDLAGVDLPVSWQGKSLLPLVTGQARSLDRDTVLIEHLWEFQHIPPSEGVRTEDWKYFRYVNDRRIEELYHLAVDPLETENLENDLEYRDVLNALRSKTDRLIQQYSDPFPGTPYGLTVELIRQPEKTLIQDPSPEFSWMVPEEAVIQRGCQILVSSDRSLLEKNIGDAWNSGSVQGNRQTGIEYGGKDLETNTLYYWKVRIYDRENRLSDYSVIQSFRTGSFNESGITQNYFQAEKIRPLDLWILEEGTFLADFGKAAFATLELDYRPAKKETLIIRLGEKLTDGRIDPDPGGHIRYRELELEVTPDQHTYLVELEPDERNTKPGAIALPDSFPVLMPFRYAEIEGIRETGRKSKRSRRTNEPLEAENLRQRAYFNYFDETAGSFASSNDTLNQVWELCKYSIKATTFAGYYVDGDRERIPYEADAYLNQLSHYSVDNEYAMARKTIEYFMHHPTWPTEWQLHVALMFREDYMYTGNTELIRQYYEPLKHKTLMALAAEDGLISTQSPELNGELMQDLGFADTTKRLRDIVDWPQSGGFGGVMGETDGFVFMPVNTVVNSFYYRNLVIMAGFAELLGKPEEASHFRAEAEKVKRSINTRLFNPELGFYVDGVGTDHGSLHANMLPLAFGIVPETEQNSVLNFIKSRGMACSVYGAQYLLEALYNAGAEDYALDLMSATDDRSWYNMIRSGSTITLEAWDMKYKPNLDWNHAWGAAPANIIPRHMWGIQPMEPAFERVSIRPQLSTLETSSIEVPTVKGKIRARFEKTDEGSSEYILDLPGNMDGFFYLETSEDQLVRQNGEKISGSTGSVSLSPGRNTIRIDPRAF